MSVADEVKVELDKHDENKDESTKMKHGDEHDMLTWLYTLDYQKVTVTIGAHMKRYHSELLVQEVGCEAWQEYAATATDMRPVLVSGGCASVVKALENFKQLSRLVWKGLSAIAEMAKHEVRLVSSETIHSHLTRRHHPGATIVGETLPHYDVSILLPTT